MHHERPDALARRVRALTGLPSVVEATEDGCAEEVLWMLRRRAADFCAAGRPREAMAEATVARAWELALRPGRLGKPASPGAPWAAARAAAAAVALAPTTAARREVR